MTSEYYDEAQEAFTHALKLKTFNEKDDNYYFIDDWMYMGFDKAYGSKFKNKFTKEYIYVEKGPRYHGWAAYKEPKGGGFLSE